jgi:hypothetical protein
MAIPKIPKKLYHGTCKAFIVYAEQMGKQFGPDSEMCFAANKDHSIAFAASWKKDTGKSMLEQYFGEKLDERLSDPVLFEIDSSALGELHYRNDCGQDTFYIEKGPVEMRSLRAIPI